MGGAVESSTVYGTVRFIDPDLSVPAQDRAIFAGPAAKLAKDESVELHDFRTSTEVAKGLAGVDVQGFTYVNHAFSLGREEIPEGTNAEDTYAKEVIDMMLKLTGASQAVIHNISFRRRLAKTQEDLYHVRRRGDQSDVEIAKLPKDRVLVNGRGDYADEPARHAHCAQILKSLRDTIRICRKDITAAAQPVIDAEEARAKGAVVKIPRYASYSVWRPLKTVKRDPIAVLDYRSIDKSELAITDFRVPSEITETGEYIVKAWLHTPPKNREALKWYYMPEQKPDEVCIIKFSDSASAEDENIAAGCIHCSPAIAGTENEDIRESVETRVYCFWD